MSPDLSSLALKPLLTLSDSGLHKYRVGDLDMQPCLGKPTKKSWYDWLDLLAVTIAILSLTAGAMIIDPRYPFAANLGYSNQIIAIGFLLGVMNQCLQRILPYFSLLVEARCGQSRLQNYEGLLRWLLFAPRFSWLWRALLIVIIILPLGLGVAYKNFEGGMALKTLGNTFHESYLPTGPPGMQDNINGQIMVANATAPLLSATRDEIPIPAGFFDQAHVYGFNTVLLSNTSAAALDAPILGRVTALQQSLAPQTSILLNASIRGTVATFNSTLDAYRNDENYWKYFDQSAGSIHLFELNSCRKLVSYSALINKAIASDNTSEQWDDSRIFVGVSNFAGINTSNLTYGSPFIKYLQQLTSRYDVRRHNCSGTWEISQNSIHLLQGACDPKPLPDQYQYYKNCELDLVNFYGQFLSQTLGDFGCTRNTSHWRVLTHAVVLAAAWQVSIAVNQGFVPVQIEGPTWSAFPHSIRRSKDEPVLYSFYEQYNSSERLVLQVPTIRPARNLYVVLAVQPLLTLLAFCATILLYDVPIVRSFGMVSVLAGVDRNTLDFLKGAALSGQLAEPVALRISILKKFTKNRDGTDREAISYSIGDAGKNAKAKLRRVYE